MPRELSTAAHERSHPYPATARPLPSPQVEADQPTEASNQHELSPASTDSGYDSGNEDWLDILDEATHDGRKSLHFPVTCLIFPLTDQPGYFSLTGYVGDDVQSLEPPAERLRCVACHRPILVPTLDIGHHPILWRLAHCHHPLHLGCLTPLGQPAHWQRLHYVHNPGSSHLYPLSLMTLMFETRTSAATRIRRRNRELPFDHRPISRFEDAERIKTWRCPKVGCGQTQFSFRFREVWYSNTHGMTMDGQFIRGPTHL
jgi:hypothetical protein